MSAIFGLPRRILTLIGTSFLTACTVGPDFVKPESGLDAVLLSPRQEHASVIPTSAAAVPSQWWTLFNDAVLTGLQARALAGNLDLQMAAERIEQSRAQLGIAASQLLPSVGANASYTREALSENGKFAALGGLRPALTISGNWASMPVGRSICGAAHNGPAKALPRRWKPRFTIAKPHRWPWPPKWHGPTCNCAEPRRNWTSPGKT
nr:hypothetical protein GCM10020185_80030 [Pseudomonas brassicacearum subsp. brassicacearum]